MSKIREARIKSGLTMKELAEETGIPYRSLQNWESEERTPPPYVEKMILRELERKESLTEALKIIDEIDELALQKSDEILQKKAAKMRKELEKIK